MNKKIVVSIIILLLFASSYPVVHVEGQEEELESIYIQDNNVVGTSDIEKIGNIYRFTSNISKNIVVLEDNIIIDGGWDKGYSLFGNNDSIGLDIKNRSNLTITNIHISGYSTGIGIIKSSEILLSNNIIINCSINGIDVRTSNNIVITDNNVGYNKINGIRLNINSNNNKITGNKIINNTNSGIILKNANNNILSENIITSNENKGIQILSESNDNIIHNNIIDNCVNGIYVQDSITNNINGNVITNNKNNGIKLIRSYYNKIYKNSIFNNRYGLDFDSTSWNDVYRNDIKDNDVGLRFSDSLDNYVYTNNFDNNTRQVRSTFSSNSWNSTYPHGGNYWSNYDGNDVNVGNNQDISDPEGDNVGDVPYQIIENSHTNQDYLPSLIPYSLITSFDIPSIIIGDSITVTGSISPVPVENSNAEISFERRNISMHTKIVPIDLDGVYSYTYSPLKGGTWSYSVSWNGDSTIIGDTTDRKEFQVKIPSIITCAVNEKTVAYGDTNLIFGEITPKLNQSAMVTLFVESNNNSFIQIVTTDITGGYNFSYTSKFIGPMSVRANWQGDLSYVGDKSSPVDFFVKTLSTISCSVNQTAINFGDSILVSGSLLPISIENAKVQISFIRDRTSLLTKSLTVDFDGVFSYIFTPNRNGTWTVEASWTGDSTYTRATSDVSSFDVIDNNASGGNLILYIGGLILIIIGGFVLLTRYRNSPMIEKIMEILQDLYDRL